MNYGKIYEVDTANWRADPPTEKQMACIREIQEFSWYGPPPFTGTTKGEASDYIEEHGKLAYEDVGSPFFGY